MIFRESRSLSKLKHLTYYQFLWGRGKGGVGLTKDLNALRKESQNGLRSNMFVYLFILYLFFGGE